MFAAGLIGTAEFFEYPPHGFALMALTIEMLLGYLTFTASLIAFAKLQELMPGRPLVYTGQNYVNLLVFCTAIGLGSMFYLAPGIPWVFPAFALTAMVFGALLIIPIGGADMPTVIALLNSYVGLSASAMGFALSNKLLIVAGALDGSSGFVLAIIMCRAMNRSFTNVLFRGFGAIVSSVAGKTEQN